MWISYSGICATCLHIPKSMYTVIFAVARTVGWIANWKEMLEIHPYASVGRGSCIIGFTTATGMCPLDRR